MSTSQTVWFITGTSRGIGLELTKQLLQSPSNVVLATCRNPSKADALQALTASSGGRLHVLPLDVSDADSITSAAQAAEKIVGDKGIDYLINNAGINPGGYDSPFEFDVARFTEAFQTNLVGPALVSKALLPLVEKSVRKTIVNVSSTVGSVSSVWAAQPLSYAIVKAGLNMLTAKQAKARPDLTVISMCPGHLQTELGGASAPTPASVGVGGVLKVLAGLTPKDTGRFINSKGDTVQW
ncbi:hypothetical protein GSI_14482 [Ganoderma sinense ZZ0214-1]|uniref:Uncharacterized protein n=1 Tax=Ganoderma sinense ZZ0214-1 TaxID=1077348 RepID=A0A2G8RNU7_9APHY|nr:hypothetical protein GSI_14482 [Ganoderma sinense ZZ0214-1]